jgi:CRISPR-associated protein Cmr5
MSVQTNSQKMALEAWRRIAERKPRKEFRNFAREFPSLVHSCGLAQAVAFAQAKKQDHADYLDDLSAVLKAVGHAEAATLEGLAHASRGDPVPAYIRLSRNALQAAGWLKRYAEATEQE